MNRFKYVHVNYGQNIHLTGLNGPVSYFHVVEVGNGTVGHAITTRLSNKNVVVIGNGEEISVGLHDNGYMTVIFSGIVRTAMLVDPDGYGKSACFVTCGLNTINESLPAKYYDVVDAEVVKCVNIQDLDIDEDIRKELRESITREYLVMLKKGGMNDGGEVSVEEKIKELESML
jgi:hypothetical protein